jgi:hypothetical protein
MKDLVENYFLDHPPGTSLEKAEVHYYCVMIARLLIDYFLSVACEPKWKTTEGWESVLSTIQAVPQLSTRKPLPHAPWRRSSVT